MANRAPAELIQSKTSGAENEYPLNKSIIIRKEVAICIIQAIVFRKSISFIVFIKAFIYELF